MSGGACAATRCLREIPVYRLLCFPHWKMIPAPLQSRLWDAYRRRGASPEKYRKVVEVIVKFIDDKEEAARPKPPPKQLQLL